MKDSSQMRKRAGRSKPLPEATPNRDVKPEVNRAEPILFIFAAVVAVLSADLFSDPPAPPFSGRSAWLQSGLHQVLGPYGVPCLFAAVAIACVVAGFAIRRRRLKP